MLELLNEIKKEAVDYYQHNLKLVPSYGTEQFLKEKHLDVSYMKTIAELIGIELCDKDLLHPPMIAMDQDEAIMTMSALVNVINELDSSDIAPRYCNVRNRDLFSSFLDNNLKDHKQKILSTYS